MDEHNHMKKVVLLRAPCLVSSGYGVHSRQIAKWLLSHDDEIDLYIQTLPWGSCSWIVDVKKSADIEKIFQKCKPLPEGVKPDVSIQVQLPNEWDPTIAKYNIGVTAAVETNKCNPAWIINCNSMDCIVVPSAFTKDVLEKTGIILKPIHVIPESYPEVFDDENSTQSKEVQEFLDGIDTSYNFIVFGQITGNMEDIDRKGILQTIRLLCEEFKKDSDVSIIVKTNQGKSTTIDKYHTENYIKKIVDANRVGPYPKVRLLHGDLTDSEIFQLLSSPKVKANVCITKGEGFGLTLLESARAGLPVVATDWSAHTEFLNLGKWVDLTSSLVDIPKQKVDNQIFVKGSKWAKVDDGHAKKRLRKIRESHSIPKEWAQELSTKIKELYCWGSIKKYMDDLLLSALK